MSKERALGDRQGIESFPIARRRPMTLGYCEVELFAAPNNGVGVAAYRSHLWSPYSLILTFTLKNRYPAASRSGTSVTSVHGSGASGVSASRKRYSRFASFAAENGGWCEISGYLPPWASSASCFHAIR